jgi:hypothetical protein
VAPAHRILDFAFSPSRGGFFMSRYKVLVEDNFHYMDERERYEAGVFSSAEEAIAECKSIVDAELTGYDDYMPRTADELFELWVLFGPDPFIVPINKNDEPQNSMRRTTRKYAVGL